MSFDRAVRHMQASAASDFEFLRQSLRDAALRFADLADIIENAPDKAKDQVGFMRESANRYRRVADLKD